MPYGIPEEAGGESAENELKMKHCVQSVMREHPDLDKANAIAICKDQLDFTKEASK